MPKRHCPICGKEAAEKTQPFCSARCKDIDLNRWLSGRYVIPGTSDDDEAERPPAQSGEHDDA